MSETIMTINVYCISRGRGGPDWCVFELRILEFLHWSEGLIIAGDTANITGDGIDATVNG